MNDDCLLAYQDLKLKKKYKYVVYKLSDNHKSIEVEKAVEASSGGDKENTNSAADGDDYDSFIAQLPRDDCRYAVYDFEYDAGEGPRNKICFYAWSPETSKIKSKMLYAASKDAIRRKLVGVGTEI